MRDVATLLSGVAAGDRRSLARAITLLESRRVADRTSALGLLEGLRHLGRPAIRVGISGIPGAGKSTLIEALGKRLIERGERVAVLAVDPSSDKTGGSILADKTRMLTLAASPRAFIRPTPSGGALGGLAVSSYETTLACEAAGYSVVFVETVGVGQSEHAVAGVADVFVLVLVAGTGDELQWMKRGVLEFVDIVVVNKADGEGTELARRTARELACVVGAPDARGNPSGVVALSVSGLEGAGVDALWDLIVAKRSHADQAEKVAARRRAHRESDLNTALEEELRRRILEDPLVREHYPRIQRAVEDGALSPREGAAQVLAHHPAFAAPATLL